MTIAQAIRKLASVGIRIYPIPYYSSYKLVIEKAKEPVGTRLNGKQLVGKMIYDKKEILTAQKRLILAKAKKIKTQDHGKNS